MPKRPPPPNKLSERTPLLEWLGAGCGLVLALGAIGYLVVQGLQPETGPPNIIATAGRVTPTSGGYVVEITAENRSRKTAAGVEIEGALGAETSAVTFDYVPGGGRRKGALVFRADPRAAPLTVVAKGHVEP